MWKRFLHALTAMMCCGLARNEERPTSEVKLNGEKVRALFDTGADLTVASLDTYKAIKKKPRLIPYRNTLTAANGQEIESVGIACFRFKLGNYEFSHDTVILKGLKTPLIIGVDIMKNHDIVLDMGRKRIMRRPGHLPGYQRNPLFSPCTCPADMWICQCAANAGEANMDAVAVGKARKNLVVEPLQAAVLEIESPEGGSVGDAYVASGLHVPQGITVTNYKGMSRILVANKNNIPIQIRRGEQVCTLEKVEKKNIVTNEEWIRRAEQRMELHGDRKIYNHNIDQSKVPLDEKEIEKAVEEVPNKYKSQFTSLIRRFSDVITSDPDRVGKCDVYKQTIRLINPEKIAAQQPYRVAPNLAHLIETYVLKLLKQGIIEHSTSPWNSPILLIKKPGVPIDNNNLMKSYRICHNYRLLNSNTHPDRYSMNSCFSLIDKVASGQIFSTIDVASAFWNQMLDEKSKPYTAFSVPSLGHFQYTRSSQGLKNSGPAWQRLLDFVVSGIPDTHIYVDDVIVASKDMQSHLKALELLFERFRQHGLLCRVSKLKFGAKTVNYLGWKISSKTGISPGDLKIKAILDYKEPKNITQIKGFLGVCNFFRKCVPFMSFITKPLTQLTRKDSTWQEGTRLPPDARDAFEKLKRILTSKPCLKPIDFNKDFYITIDSSAFGTGLVLSQLHGSVEHPNLYLSKTNPDCHKKRSAFHIESEGIIWGMRQLKPLIAAGKCFIRTDHKPLASLDKTSTPMLDKVYAELEDFNFTMQYLPGKSMISDGLSRQDDHSKCLLCKGEPAGSVDSITVSNWAELADVLNGGRRKLESELQNRFNNVNEICPQPHSCYELDLEEPRNNMHPERLMAISDSQILEQQKFDRYIKAIVCYLKFNKLPDKPELRNWVMRLAPNAEIVNGIVGLRVGQIFKILAPMPIRPTLIHLAHDSAFGGHGNWKKTLGRLNYWTWPGITRDVENYCLSCTRCQQNNAPGGGYTKMPLNRLKIAQKFGDKIHADLLGPLVPSGESNYRYCLILTDSYSSFTKVIPLVSKHSDEVAKAILTQWISHFMCPLSITTDQGSEFTAGVFRNLCKYLGCELVYSSIEHPQSNSMAERTIRNILGYVRKFIEGQADNWSGLIPNLMGALNTSIHSDKKVTPFQLVFGYQPVLPTTLSGERYNYEAGGLPQLMWNHYKLQQEALLNRNKAFERNKAYYDQKMNKKSFQPGDIVYLQAPSRTMKMDNRFIGPMKVIAVRDVDNLHMQHLETGKSYFAHFNRVKLGYLRDQTAHTTNTRFQGYEEDGDVTNGTSDSDGGAVQNAESATPALNPAGQAGNELADDLLRNLNSSKGEVIKGEEKKEAQQAVKNVQNEPAKDYVYRDTDATLSRPIYGPMTRARKKLLDEKGMKNILNTIKNWNQYY